MVEVHFKDGTTEVVNISPELGILAISDLLYDLYGDDYEFYLNL